MTSIITMTGHDAHRAAVIARRTGDAFIAGLLKAELSRRIVRITFLKKDGTVTTRFGTTVPAMASRHINGRGMDSDSRNVVCFWDVEAEGSNKWRSFRYEKLISFE